MNAKEKKMDSLFKLSHSELADYIRSTASAPLLKRVENLRGEDASYGLLFDMIDNVRYGAGIPSESRTEQNPIPLEPLNVDHNQLEGLLSGNATVADGRSFLSQLMSSQRYYQQFFLYLLEMDPQRQSEIVSDLGEVVQVRSNRELIEDVIGIVPKPAKSPGGFTLPDFLNNFGWRFATAIPALLVLLLVGNAFMAGPLGKFDVRENAPNGYQHNLVNATRGATQSHFDVNNLLRQIQSLIGLLVTSSSDYDTSEYDEAIAMLSKGKGIAQKLRRESIAAMEDSLAHQPDSNLANLLMEARKVTQDYHFYLGIYHLVRNKPGDAKKAVALLTDAKLLAEGYALDTAHRESYYLGLANAFADDKATALKLLRAIPENSPYSVRANTAIERLGLNFFERMIDW